MRVLIVEPYKEPYEKDIDNSLKSMQKIVGGLIKPVYMDENTAIICNEEGKLMGLEGNRRVGRDIIAGTFFIAGMNDEGEFVSLTDEQLKACKERFNEPEEISPEEVEDSICIEFYAFGPDEEMEF
ncbi:MAG: hypothetical protein PWQ70_568 [Clostridiales bacterium]|nr:hypothetical protein [Clostridiales bacterium]